MIAYALNPNLENPDAAYPYLISTLVPTGLRSILFAALIGAIMSTIDSLLNSTSSLLTLYIYKKFFNKDASDKALVRFAQICGAILLIFATLWCPMVGRFESIFNYVEPVRNTDYLPSGRFGYLAVGQDSDISRFFSTCGYHFGHFGAYLIRQNAFYGIKWLAKQLSAGLLPVRSSISPVPTGCATECSGPCGHNDCQNLFVSWGSRKNNYSKY